jgi:hypothetical protein
LHADCAEKNEAQKLISIFCSNKHFQAAFADGAFDRREYFRLLNFQLETFPQTASMSI